MFICKLSKKRYLISIFIIVIIELVLRIFWGFCDAPLSVSSKNYEYIFAPSQRHVRFGNTVSYNSHSQRNSEINNNMTPILCLGDSVLNGGVQTDDSELATSIVTSTTRYQCLNISAGSWGPDNCAAYLCEKGVFHSKMMILVVSSHDAFDNMDFVPVVGVSPTHPAKQYTLAIVELWDRYLTSRVINYFFKKKITDPDEKVSQRITKNGKSFNSGFNQLLNIARENNMKFIIYLHPEKEELHHKKYNEQGNLIIKWAHDNKIFLFLGIDRMEKNDYRDNIHINSRGQEKLAYALIEIINSNY